MKDQFMQDCAPHFFDGLVAAVDYARRMQQEIQQIVEGRQAEICQMLGYSEADVAVNDYWHPKKFQLISTEDNVEVGIELKLPGDSSLGVFRAEIAEDGSGEGNSWLGIWFWTKPKAKLDRFVRAVEVPLECFPQSEKHWELERSHNYCCWRQLSGDEIVHFRPVLDELLDHYLAALRSIGGAKRILDGASSPAAPI